MSGGWSNDSPNPLEVGGGGESGSLIVYDAAGRIIATLDEDGLTFQGYDGAGNAIEFNPSALPGHTVQPASIVTSTDTSGFTDSADLVITGAALDGGDPAVLAMGFGGGVISTAHVDLYSPGSIELIADNGWDINLIADRVFAGGDVLTGTLIGCETAAVSQAAMTAGTDTTSSTSFANMAGTGSVTSVSMFKRYDDSKLKATLAGTFYVNNANSAVEFALRIDGVDYVVGRMINTLPVTQRLSFNFFAIVPAGVVAAGSHTVQARWRNASGIGTATRDVNDWLSIDIEERG